MPRKRSRAGGEGSLYQDASTGRWVAAITIGTDANGRQIRRRATAARKADAAAKLRELQRQKGLSPAAAGSARTLGAYLTGWLADIKASKAAATYDSYRHAVEGHIVPHLGSVSIERLTPLHVQRWLTALDGVGGRARQNAFKVLRRSLNVAVKLQVIASNPTDGFEAPRHQREPINPFTADSESGKRGAKARWEIDPHDGSANGSAIAQPFNSHAPSRGSANLAGSNGSKHPLEPGSYGDNGGDAGENQGQNYGSANGSANGSAIAQPSFSQWQNHGSSSSSSSSNKKKVKRVSVTDHQFDLFWTEVPRKVKKRPTRDKNWSIPAVQLAHWCGEFAPAGRTAGDFISRRAFEGGEP